MAALSASSRSIDGGHHHQRTHSDNFREFPRSPTSISPVSSRRTSLLAPSSENSSDPASISPPMRLTRKRAASLNTDAANHQGIEDLGPSSADTSSPTAGTAREQVCLCQPEPKIPRPRNAFILYRQHYQAQVVAQNPGLANPEISKIIGDQWRKQPPDVKNEWRRLAEEEKQRHQRQYPEYRYQPRRAGKANGSRVVSAASGEDRCPKCNGRYISTPSTPLTPFASSSSGGQTPRLLPSFTPHTPPREDHPGYSSTTAAMSNSRNLPPQQGQVQRRQPFQGPIPSGTSSRDEEVELSPEMKRRRYNEVPQAYPSPSLYGPPQYLARPPQMSAIGYKQDYRRLPGPSHIIQHQGSMEPPPRPTQVYSAPRIYPPPTVYTPSRAHSPSQAYSPPRSQAFDESLRLPPLQTQLSWSDNRQYKESQARSIEAMVMTIPYTNKIKVLSRIAPPLAAPGPGSPVQETRGAVIAVEGSDTRAVAEVGRFLEDYLNRDAECAVKTWTSSPASKAEPVEKGKESSVDVKMSGPEDRSTVTPSSSSSNDKFIAYLDEMHAWHERSIEISKYITATPSTTYGSTNTSPAISSHPTSPTNTSVESSVSTSTPAKPRIPVALMPTGFSLTTSDHYASIIPINDAYAPVDHWQWTATLWRGIVGPDLTIYVKTIGPELEDREDMARWGGVEIKLDCGAIIVRTETGANGNGMVEEKILRRLGFEVLEFVRSIGTGAEEGRGPFWRG